MADPREVFAIVTQGSLKGQQVYVCSTLEDGMCICNIGQDEAGETRYTQLPKQHLRVARARPMVRALVAQATGPIPRGPAHSGATARPLRDWTWIHPLLTPAV